MPFAFYRASMVAASAILTARATKEVLRTKGSLLPLSTTADAKGLVGVAEPQGRTTDAEAMVSAEAMVCAETEALAAARQLWSDHKLAPEGLPPPNRAPRVLSDGLTILNPFVSVGLSPGGEPATELV